MKKRILLSIILILMVIFTSFSYATENSETEGAAIPEEWRRDEIVNEEMNIISESYSILEDNPLLEDTIIDGNLFVFGSNIILNNVKVSGDIFLAGEKITLSNVMVYGTGFVAGETVNMNNVTFTGNLFNASATFNFTGTSSDLFAATEILKINEGSYIAREIFAGAGKAQLKGVIVGKNAHISTEELKIEDKVYIEGNLNYSSENEASISENTSIGNINFDKTEIEKEDRSNKTLLTSFKTYNVVTSAIKAIFIGGFIFLFAKGFIEKQKVDNIVKYTAVSAIKGLGWSVIIPIIGMLLLFTGVSVGLSIVVFIAYFVIFWASLPVVAIAITANIKTKREYNVWRAYGYTLLIAIIIAILKQLPIIGGFVTIIVGLAGMGIVMSSFKRKKQDKNVETIEAEIVE